jgi:hypothetical protein
MELEAKNEKGMLSERRKETKTGRKETEQPYRPIVKLCGTLKLLFGPTFIHQHARFTVFNKKG